MAKKLMTVIVKGKHEKWGFHFYGDPKNLPYWLEDGLEINVIENLIPMWIVEIGLLKPYVFMQNIFNFKNPFKG